MDWEKKIVPCLHLFYNELYDWLWFIYDIGQNRKKSIYDLVTGCFQFQDTKAWFYSWINDIAIFPHIIFCS